MAETAAARKIVAILIPASDSIPGRFLSHFARAYVSLLQSGMAVRLFTSDKVPLDQARQELLEKALSAKPFPD